MPNRSLPLHSNSSGQSGRAAPGPSFLHHGRPQDGGCLLCCGSPQSAAPVIDAEMLCQPRRQQHGCNADRPRSCVSSTRCRAWPSWLSGKRQHDPCKVLRNLQSPVAGPMRVASQPVRVGPTEDLPPRRELLHDEMHDSRSASCTTPYSPCPVLRRKYNVCPVRVRWCPRGRVSPCRSTVRLRTAPVGYVASASLLSFVCTTVT